MKKRILLIISAIITLFLILFLISFFLYKNALKPVSSSEEEILFEVGSGSTYLSLADDLYDQKLIRSKEAYQLYIRLNPPEDGLKTGVYKMRKNMSVEDIIEALGEKAMPIVKITFPEGISMREVTKIITENTNHTEEEVLATLQDQDYLKHVIDDYWFVDNSILNSKLYYSLEGYLFPETYYFDSRDVSVSAIFDAMLDQMGKRLEEVKPVIESSSYSIHEILTMASMVELEAITADDRKMVSGIFYNRLKKNMNLGSDVTTYYGVRLDLHERDLKQTEIDNVNAYNTRLESMRGRFPIGPICIPSMVSIRAALYPTESEYYYFAFDKNGKAYYNVTNEEHNKTVSDLKEKGIWERFPS